MHTIIIPSSLPCTLSPLLLNKKLYDLSLCGKTILDFTKENLLKHGGTEISFSPDGISLYKNIGDSYVLAFEEGLLTDTDLSSAIRFHLTSNADITVILNETDASAPCVSLDKNGYITAFLNSGTPSLPSSYTPVGIYIIKTSRISALSDTVSGFDILKSALNNSLTVSGFTPKSYFKNIINPEAYRAAIIDILNKKGIFSLNASEINPGFWVESGANIESGVKIESPVYISSGCRVESGAHLLSGTYIDKNTVIKQGSKIYNSVIGKNCNIDESSNITGSMLSDNVSIGNGCSLRENSIISSGCRLEPNCVIYENVKIWPNKRILKDTRIRDNLIHGSVGTEKLFRCGKIQGEINTDITPEFMAKLGTAAGTLFCGEKIGISFDSSPVCSMLGYALASGIISTGTQLYIFGEQSLPITRLATVYYRLSASVHINHTGKDGTYYPEIEIIESDGTDFSISNEKKLEQIFFDGIFNRAESNKISEPTKLYEYKLSYVQSILNEIKSKYFHKNVSISTRSETVSDVLELILYELEKITDVNNTTEFSAEISNDGQNITLFDKNKNEIDKNKVFAIGIILLIEHFNSDKIVLPVSAPTEIYEYAKSKNKEIIKSETKEREFMHTILKNNLTEQFKLFFDGVYFSIALLDYLNNADKTLSDLLSVIPSFSILESEIECPDSRKNEIIKQLYETCGDDSSDMTDGIKIYKSNGWILVLPEKYRHCIKIITEGYTMESAEEIASFFTNKIKKLAKPE